MKNKRIAILLIGLGILVVVAIVWLIFGFGNDTQQEKKKVKAGFIMSGSMEEVGWNGKHYAGMKVACDEQGIELLVKENVAEFSGQCEKAIHELAKAGAEVIVLSSYGYSEEMQEVVKKYPQIVFYANSFEFQAENVSSYFVRMYQARYLAGVIAGLRTETNEIGYVAAMENSEVNRGINAFTLGVRKVNPQAEVLVTWTNSWDDEEKEKAAVKKLAKENVDVITYHQNQANVVRAADELGIYSIGYHEAVTDCSAKYLTSIVCDWEKVYKELMKKFMQGRGNLEKRYWIGLEEDVIALTEYSELVPQNAVQQVEAMKAEILTGDGIFSGEIYDNEGKLRCGKSEIIGDDILLKQMNWFVEGVRIYEK